MLEMKLFKPNNARGLSTDEIRNYYFNVPVELAEIDFTSRERTMLDDVKLLGKLLDDRTRPFFFYHIIPLLLRAVEVFFSKQGGPLILELGCGSGSTSILLGLLGARVVGIDLDADLINACRKRQSFYEESFGKLDIRFHATDVFGFDYEDLAPFDGIYSLFAFNLMQPSRDLLPRLVQALRPGGNLVVSDGNRSAVVNALFRRRSVLKPQEMAVQLSTLGCKVISLDYDCAIPPGLVKNKHIFPLALKGENALHAMGLMRWMGVSYTVIAEKT